MDRSYEEKSFGEILGVANTHYEVPFFRRGYVWNEEKWKELLCDIFQQICDLDIDIDPRKSGVNDFRAAIKQMGEIEEDRFQEILKKQRLLLWNHLFTKQTKYTSTGRS